MFDFAADFGTAVRNVSDSASYTTYAVLEFLKLENILKLKGSIAETVA